MKMHYKELERRLEELGSEVYLDYDNTLEVVFNEDKVFPLRSEYVVLSGKEGQLIKFHTKNVEDIEVSDKLDKVSYKEDVLSIVNESVVGTSEDEAIYRLESLYGGENDAGIVTLTYVDDNLFYITFESEIDEYEEYDGYTTVYTKSIFTQKDVDNLPEDIQSVLKACKKYPIDKRTMH